MKKTRAILYARVSTEMQVEGGLSIPAQINEMREYAERRGWEVVAEFTDPGFSGSSTNRPGLQATLQALEQKQADVLLVHELSRLSRSIFDTFSLFDRLGHLNIGFASVKDPDFDFSSPQSRLFLTIIAAMNQYYLDLLKQHTAKGKRERARQGLYNASITPYGYQHVGDSRTPPEIVDKEAPAVRLAFETYATGNASFQDVADRLNEAGFRTRSGERFSKDTIDDMLRNPFYAGKVVYGSKRKGQPPEIFEGQHDEIISPELFEAVTRMRQKRHGASRAYNVQFNTYLLNVIGVCNICGRTLRAQATTTNRYYREMSRVRGFIDCPNAQKGVVAEVVETQIEAIFSRLRLPPDWQAEIEGLLDRESEVEALNNRRARLEAEKRRIRDLYIRGHYEEDIERYEQDVTRIQRELDSLPTGDLTAISEAAEILENLAYAWEQADMIIKRDLLRLVLRQVEVDVQQGRIISLTPYPVFLPLFRQSEHLHEIELGRFIPIWPPEVARQEGPDTVLPPLTEPGKLDPTRAVAWPFVISVPNPPASQRITPHLSDFLKSYRQAQQAVRTIVELGNPGYPQLRLDERKWPGLSIIRFTQASDELLESLQPGSVSLLYAPCFLTDKPYPDRWFERVAQILEPGGCWTLIEVLPGGMPGHWLYRFFPETWDIQKERTLSPISLYQGLQKQDFIVEWTQRSYYQAVSGAVALAIAEQRSASSLLSSLPDECYEMGLTRLRTAITEKGVQSLLASQFCLVEVKAQQPRQLKKSTRKSSQ